MWQIETWVLWNAVHSHNPSLIMTIIRTNMSRISWFECPTYLAWALRGAHSQTTTPRPHSKAVWALKLRIDKTIARKNQQFFHYNKGLKPHTSLGFASLDLVCLQQSIKFLFNLIHMPITDAFITPPCFPCQHWNPKYTHFRYFMVTNSACWWVSHNASFWNSQTYSVDSIYMYIYIRLRLSISSISELYSGNVAEMPYQLIFL